MADNFHACAILVGDRGVLVAGPSGSGKTELCLALLDHCRLWGEFARLVSDDQVFLSAANGRLIATAPKTIAGLIEVRGLVPTRIAYAPSMVVDLLVRLVPASEAPRMAEERSAEFPGCSVPVLDLPANDARHAVAAIAARFGIGPFRTP
jgi:serine kinase of HPr protein (carbohydrate metabolism regulator)